MEMKMQWIRGKEIGHGSFASVSRAKIKKNSLCRTDLPSLVALKSSDLCTCDSLKVEKRVLDRIGACSHVVRCFGAGQSVERGRSLYSLVLELAFGGTLSDEIRRRGGGGLPEQEIRRHTRAVLEGLSEIHAKGFVHCDVKPQNILLFDGGEAKIADLGLAKETGQTVSKREVRGTAQYQAPESVSEGEYEAPCDVWALGCVVVEMVTGRRAWNDLPDSNVWGLLIRIGSTDELPEIPKEVSEEGKDFLGKCFMKDPRNRWTARMLLDHPFVA